MGGLVCTRPAFLSVFFAQDARTGLVSGRVHKDTLFAKDPHLQNPQKSCAGPCAGRVHVLSAPFSFSKILQSSAIKIRGPEREITCIPLVDRSLGLGTGGGLPAPPGEQNLADGAAPTRFCKRCVKAHAMVP